MKKRLLASFVVAFVLVAFLLSRAGFRETASVLFSISPVFILLGFLLYVMSHLFRAVRFMILLDKKVKLKDLFYTVCVHNMANNILPARAGELSYIYLIKKTDGVLTSKGVSSLVIARAFDLFTIALLFFISTQLTRGALRVDVNPESLGVIVFLMLVSFYLFFLKSEEIARLLEKFAGKNRLSQIVLELGVVKKKRIILHMLWTTFMIWLCLYGITYLLLLGMGFEMGFFYVVLGSTLSFFTNILPIPSVGSLGVYEGAWAIVFIPLGLPVEAAIASGFGAHVLFLTYTGALGFYGLLKVGSRSSEEDVVDETTQKYFDPLTRGVTEKFIENVSAEVDRIDPQTLLDVGCGNGYLTKKLVERSNIPRCVAVDLDTERISRAGEHPKISFSVLDAEDLSRFEDSSFELVTALELIEHLRDPDKALRELKRVSKKNVLVTVPNEPFFRLANLLRGKNLARFGNPPDHVQHFNGKTLKNLLKKYFPKVEVKKNAFFWLTASCEK